MLVFRWISAGIAQSCLLCAECAHANIPLPTLSALSVNGGMGWIVLACGFVLVSLCEALVLRFVFRQHRGTAIRLSFGVNLVTTFIGFALSFHPFEILALFLALPYSSHLMKVNLRWKAWVRVPIWLATGVLFFLILVAFPNNDVPWLVLQFYALMCFSFLLTIFLETGLFAARVNPGIALRWSVVCNGASYALLFGAMVLLGFRSAAVADTAAARTWVTMHDSRGLSRPEIVRRIEQVYQWEDSANGWILRGNRRKETVPRSELRLIVKWAAAGHSADAEALYEIVNRHRPPVPQEQSDENPWQEATEAIDSARNTGKAG